MPDGLRDCGGLRQHLSAVLPELGTAPQDTDRPTLAEAIRCAFEEIARKQATAGFLDDLQWVDEATLELLPLLAASFSG